MVLMVIWGNAETLLAINITGLFTGRPRSFPMYNVRVLLCNLHVIKLCDLSKSVVDVLKSKFIIFVTAFNTDVYFVPRKI
jgi:hypothetical protein